MTSGCPTAVLLYDARTTVGAAAHVRQCMPRQLLRTAWHGRCDGQHAAVRPADSQGGAASTFNSTRPALVQSVYVPVVSIPSSGYSAARTCESAAAGMDAVCMAGWACALAAC